MKSNKNEQAERLFTALGDLDPHTLSSAAAYTPPARRKGNYRRVLTAVLAAALSLCIVTLTVFATVPSLRGMLNLPFLSESERQETVPEGWVGIYTVEDLDNVRNDLGGQYILMNDLTFADGAAPFNPIGTRQEPFTGRFDGNGHVIRGLVIEVEQETPQIVTREQKVNGVLSTYTCYEVAQTQFMVASQKTQPVWAGLFGYCGKYYTEETPYSGMITNLGIEGARLTVDNASSACVGFIAGRASYLAGCYVKDSTISISGYTRGEADKAAVDIKVGGLIGDADLVDSCYTQNIHMTATNFDELDTTPYNFFMGGLAGDAYTVITSYAESFALNVDTDQLTAGDLWGHVNLLHDIMTESQYEEVYERYYRAVYGMSEDDPLPPYWKTPEKTPGYDDNAFICRKFTSYYIDKTLSEMVDLGFDFENMDPAFLMGEFSPEMVMYFKDPTQTMEEIMKMEDQIIQRIDAEKLCEIMICNNRKVGPLDCYTLDSATTYKKSDFASFDFESIWEMKDGKPVLRIFED